MRLPGNSRIPVFHRLAAAGLVLLLVCSFGCTTTASAESPSPAVSEIQAPKAEAPANTVPAPANTVSEPVTTVASEAVYTDQVSVSAVSSTESAILEGSGAIATVLKTEAPGILEERCNKAVIDYSNTKDGYVMAVFTAESTGKLRLILAGPTTQYTYVLTSGVWAAFPLADGNGSYTVKIYEEVKKSGKYAQVLSASFQVTMDDPFAPFLRPNQYVNYTDAVKSMEKATELAQGKTDTLEIVEAIYKFVVRTLTYDTPKALSVTAGYLPVLDEVLASRKGICFDYAALMAGMLRSLGIPCKLVVGYVGEVYHAWINVYVDGVGWIDGVIYFDGESWQRMDPTFASSAGGTKFIESYIGKGKDYAPKYFY